MSNRHRSYVEHRHITGSAAVSDPTLKKRALRGAAWYGATRVVIQAMSWIMTIAVARALLPRDYGLLGMACVYTGLVEFLYELGLGVAIVQKKELDDDDLNTVFWLGVTSSLILYGATFLVSPLVAGFYDQPKLTTILRVLGFCFIVLNFRLVPWNMLARRLEFKKRSMTEVAGNLCGSLVTLVMAYSGCGVWALVVGLLARDALITAQVWAMTTWRPRRHWSWTSLKRIMPLSLNTAGARGIWYGYDISDRLIIGKFLGDLALGYYTLTQRLTTDLIGRVVSIVNVVGFPVYSSLQDEHHRLRRYFLTSIQLACIAVLPSMAGLSLVSSDLIPLLLKAKWTPMVPALQLMCWASPIAMLFHISNAPVLARGEAAVILRFNLLALAVMPAGFFIATRFGLQGVCLVWLTLFPMLELVWFRKIRPIIGFQWQELWAAIRPGAVSTLFMVAALLAVKAANIGSLSAAARVAVLVTVGVIAYLGCLLACFREPLRRLIVVMRARSAESSAVPIQA